MEQGSPRFHQQKEVLQPGTFVLRGKRRKLGFSARTVTTSVGTSVCTGAPSLCSALFTAHRGLQ
uniref:Uncharacterized protein n=1 Tax=Astyanax mexicanus TaxID=7994 RepID=A0A8B9JNU5_ASTMX